MPHNFNNNAPGNSDALKFKNIADGLNCPWYSVRGNKESTARPEGDPLNQGDYARMFFPSDLKVSGRGWKLERGKYTILGLDTTIEQNNNGIFTPATLDFVEKELKTNPKRYYILLNHQTYWNFWGGTDKGDFKLISPLLRLLQELALFSLALTPKPHKLVLFQVVFGAEPPKPQCRGGVLSGRKGRRNVIR